MMNFEHECRDCGKMISYSAQSEIESVVIICTGCARQIRLNSNAQTGRNGDENDQ